MWNLLIIGDSISHYSLARTLKSGRVLFFVLVVLLSLGRLAGAAAFEAASCLSAWRGAVLSCLASEHPIGEYADSKVLAMPARRPDCRIFGPDVQNIPGQGRWEHGFDANCPSPRALNNG